MRTLDQLGPYAVTFQLLETSRLVRDKEPVIRKKAFELLASLVQAADEAQVAMVVKDIAPHVWHFTDDPSMLDWLEGLAALGMGNKNDLKLLGTSLKGARKYNAGRGLGR